MNFVIGLIFAIVFIPLLDGFTSLILSFFEVIKSYFSKIIAINNQKIQKLSIDAPQRAIGFSIREEVENDNDNI